MLAIGIVLFIGLVLVHEWGHFTAARRNGVEVEEFGLFFPPRARVLTKKNGTEYTLNWLPLGGFVKLKGENDADRRPGTFGAATYWVKVKIMLAGVVMNLITALAILTLLAIIGMPKLIDDQFTIASDTTVVQNDVFAAFVSDDSPAAQAGLRQGDIIESITKDGADTMLIKAADDLPNATEQFAGSEVEVSYLRGGESATVSVQLLSEDQVKATQDSDQPRGYLGVVPAEYTVQRSTWSAPLVAGGLMAQMTALTFEGLGTAIVSLFQGDTTTASEQVAGPVGVFAVMQQGSLFGIEYILMIIAIISLSLAIMNALPIPALDGGRLFVLTVSKLAKKPLTKEAEEAIHGAGFLFLIGLIILITVVDVKRFF